MGLRDASNGPGYDGSLVPAEQETSQLVIIAEGEVESAGLWLASVRIDADDREAGATTSDALNI